MTGSIQDESCICEITQEYQLNGELNFLAGNATLNDARDISTAIQCSCPGSAAGMVFPGVSQYFPQGLEIPLQIDNQYCP
jgi:hypothetical protein